MVCFQLEIFLAAHVLVSMVSIGFGLLQGVMQMIEFNIGYAFLILFAVIIVVAWLTIDDDDFNKRFEHNRKARVEDEEI